MSNIQVVEALNGRIQTFTGDDNQLFTEWLKEYADILTVFEVHQNQGKEILPLYLSATAKIKYELLTIEERSTWESLTLALAKKLKNDDTIRNIKAELLSFRMGDLTLSEYAQKVRKMVKIVYQGQGNEKITKECIYYLIICLNDNIRWKVERMPTPSTFEDAYNVISKNLRILKEKRDREKEHDRVNTLALLNRRLEELEFQNESNGDEYPEFDGGDQNCDEYDPYNDQNYCEADEENYPYDEAHDDFDYECDPEENDYPNDQFEAGNGGEVDPNFENSWDDQEYGHDDENYQYESENYGSEGQQFHGDSENFHQNPDWTNNEFDPEHEENYYHHDKENYQNENDETWDEQHAQAENIRYW